MSAVASATVPERVEAERVRAALDDVLADERFSENPLLAWLSELLDRIGEALFGSKVGEGLSDALAVLGWGLVAVLLVVLTVLIAKRVGRPARAPELEPYARDPVAERVAELQAAARAAEGAGDLLLALRLYFFALVIGLGERGELSYRDAWTNRELFERGRPSAAVRARLAPLVRDLDRKSFGGEPVLEADVRRVAGLCAAWLTRRVAPGVARAGAEPVGPRDLGVPSGARRDDGAAR